MKAFLRCGIAERAMQAFFDNQTRNGVMGGGGVLECWNSAYAPRLRW